MNTDQAIEQLVRTIRGDLLEEVTEEAKIAARGELVKAIEEWLTVDSDGDPIDGDPDEQFDADWLGGVRDAIELIKAHRFS